MPHFNEEFQTKVIDEDIANGHKEIPDNLCPTLQRGARETDMPCHPETCEESDGKLEHECGNMRRESNEAEVKHLSVEDEMIKNIVQHPLQDKV